MSTNIKMAPVSATLAPAYCVYVKMCCLHAQQNHSAYMYYTVRIYNYVEEFLRCKIFCTRSVQEQPGSAYR